MTDQSLYIKATTLRLAKTNNTDKTLKAKAKIKKQHR